MPPKPARHPDDVAAQRRLLTELITIRVATTTPQAVAEHLGITASGVEVFEQQRADSARCATISAYARAVGRRVEYRAVDIPWPVFETAQTADLLHRAAAADPAGRDALMLEYLIRRAAAARRWLGISATDAGAAMGVVGSAINQLEGSWHGPARLSTLQRYLRAIGGRLDTKLHAISGLEVAA